MYIKLFRALKAGEASVYLRSEELAEEPRGFPKWLL
jgi:hypothetical protein